MARPPVSRTAVLACLSNGSTTLSELRLSTGLSRAAVISSIHQLRSRGFIIHTYPDIDPLYTLGNPNGSNA